MPHQRIYLIGMPGCGKSTFGKKLAKAFSYKFIDLDKEIENSTNKSIPQIFEELGEVGFRKLEKEVLIKTTFQNHLVIACGGGTPSYEDNIKLMNNAGLSIYLKVPLSYLAKRILDSKTPRPLFIGKNKEEIILKVEEIFEQRRCFYEAAKVIIESNQERRNLLLNKSLQT
ncbi:MAG: shikimate kinase [Bacteroidia bacterium]|nr:shikimate kinase [Bacteroidia bacterium]MCF8426830.1 shikimate kinase [Bacteroidia bacterium]MCF8446802.1 shikimate kinase [Bacteroidia bacterium]